MKRRSLFWNFVQSGEDTTSIYLYDEIAKEKSDVWTGERWEKGSEVSALEFKGQLDQVSTPNILVRINSAGGDVFEASAMAQAITIQ